MIGFNALCALFDRGAHWIPPILTWRLPDSQIKKDDEIPTKTSHQRKKSDAGMRKETNITNMYIYMWDGTQLKV